MKEIDGEGWRLGCNGGGIRLVFGPWGCMLLLWLGPSASGRGVASVATESIFDGRSGWALYGGTASVCQGAGSAGILEPGLAAGVTSKAGVATPGDTDKVGLDVFCAIFDSFEYPLGEVMTRKESVGAFCELISVEYGTSDSSA